MRGKGHLMRGRARRRKALVGAGTRRLLFAFFEDDAGVVGQGSHAGSQLVVLASRTHDCFH